MRTANFAAHNRFAQGVEIERTRQIGMEQAEAVLSVALAGHERTPRFGPVIWHVVARHMTILRYLVKHTFA